MYRQKREDFYVKGFMKGVRSNEDLRQVLICLAKKYNDMVHETIRYKDVKIRICNECKNILKVDISEKQISRLLKIKKYFPYKSIAILMAIYNLLKRETEHCNEPEIEDLEAYIRLVNGYTMLIQEFCLERSLSEKIYNHADYAGDGRYSRIYELYIATYENFISKIGGTPFLKMCEKNFTTAEEFTESDIPDGMKMGIGREYLI